MPPIDPSDAGNFIEQVGFPVAVAVATIALAAALLWLQDKARKAELERQGSVYEHQLRDRAAAGDAWKQLYERADAERRANAAELAEQLKTLDMAIELIHRNGGGRRG